jgi:hypothetical protein
MSRAGANRRTVNKWRFVMNQSEFEAELKHEGFDIVYGGMRA